MPQTSPYTPPPPIGPWLRTLPGLPLAMPMLTGLPRCDVEAEMVGLPHLSGDIAYKEPQGIVHRTRDARKDKAAKDHVGKVPGREDGLHLVCSGKYALWDLAVAIMSLAEPVAVADIYLATLGFSTSNVSDMVEMLDAGKIRRLSLVCSNYFRGTSKAIWEFAETEFSRRATSRFLTIRTHCKIIAMRFDDGRSVTMEASSNLRANGNIEQVSIFGHPDLYTFHAGWLEELFTRGGGK